MPIWFEIDGIPVGKGRARSSSRIVHSDSGRAKVATRHYTPQRTRDYEASVAIAAKAAMRGRKPLSGPVLMRLTIGLPIPASWSQKKREAAALGEIWPTSKPDGSNVQKAIEDGMNGIVYVDDAQIVRYVVDKVYAITPGVSVRIEEIKP